VSGSHVLLLTGPPGIGKTTAMRRIAAALAGRKIGGFTTEEIRPHLDGQPANTPETLKFIRDYVMQEEEGLTTNA